MVCLAAVLTGLYFVSCGNDDKKSDSGAPSDLIGTWAESDGGEEVIMFCSNGTCYVYELCSEHGVEDIDKGEYIYNSNKETISILFGDEVETCNVVALTKSKLVVSFRSSYGTETVSFTKVKDIYTASQLDKLSQSYSSYRSY